MVLYMNMHTITLHKSGDTYMVVLPKKMVRDLELEKGDSLFVKQEGKIIQLYPTKYCEIVIR